MRPTTYGREELILYDDLSGRAFQRLVDALAGMGDGSDRHTQTLLEDAFRRRCARLQSVFPKRSLPGLVEGFFSPATAVRQICLVTAYWIDCVKALADDNELDIPQPDGDGRVRRLGEIVAEAILDDAVLAGRLIEIRRL